MVGGQSALELSCFAGKEASQLPGAVKGGGGESALVVVLLSVFVLGGAGGQSASGL